VSGDPRKNFREQIEHVKLNKNVLYYFAKFAIVNELLIIKDGCIRHARDRPLPRRCEGREKLFTSDNGMAPNDAAAALRERVRVWLERSYPAAR